MLIVETGPGWVCANAGIDESNSLVDDRAILLPEDADASAAALRDGLKRLSGVDVAVLVTDTFGRPWRDGLTEVCLGIAGLDPMLDLRGTTDLAGRELHHTVIAIADEIACAAGLLMPKAGAYAGRTDPRLSISARGQRQCQGADSACRFRFVSLRPDAFEERRNLPSPLKPPHRRISPRR